MRPAPTRRMATFHHRNDRTVPASVRNPSAPQAVAPAAPRALHGHSTSAAGARNTVPTLIPNVRVVTAERRCMATFDR